MCHVTLFVDFIIMNIKIIIYNVFYQKEIDMGLKIFEYFRKIFRHKIGFASLSVMTDNAGLMLSTCLVANSKSFS